MIKQETIITAINGLHIRPAAIFVKEAKKFNSSIIIEANKKKANAKSLFKIQTLGIVKNTKVILSAEGDDEKTAIKKLIDILNKFE